MKKNISRKYHQQRKTVSHRADNTKHHEEGLIMGKLIRLFFTKNNFFTDIVENRNINRKLVGLTNNQITGILPNLNFAQFVLSYFHSNY